MTIPRIVIIDDEPESSSAVLANELNHRGAVSAAVFSPGEVTAEILEDASLVLVDYQLDYWPERARQSEIALMPLNGLALAGVLREYCERSGNRNAIALLSNQLNILFGGLSPENRRHVLSRVTSLEWVFSKTDDTRVDQIEILARGMLEVENLVYRNELDPHHALLSHDQQGIVDDAWEGAIDRCLPPVNELSQLTHGAAFARWFLQRVLPYPTFLIDSNHVAARLQISADSLRTVLEHENDLSIALGKIEYSGVFSGFLGRRWHKSFLEDWLWIVTNNRSFDSAAIETAVAIASDGLAVPTAVGPDVVVTVGDNYESTTDFESRDECIAVFPDDWPAYADRAYLRLADVKSDPSLSKLVMHDERWRLEEDQ
jgi:hypothetical protein